MVNPLAYSATWDNNGFGSWTIPSNWVGGSAPVNGEVITINNGGTAIIDNINANTGFVYLGSTGGTSGNIHVTNGGSILAGGEINIGYNGNGTLVLDSGLVSVA